MPQLLKQADKNLEFLLNLDKKLHSKQEIVEDRFPHPVRKYKVDDYKNSKMSEDELHGFVSALESSNNLVLHPVNTNMGLSVGFSVTDVSKRKPVLMFLEKQLPDGYNFKALSIYFMREKNLQLAKEAEIEIHNNRDHYDY